jgi:hypothetical protein
VLSLLNSDAALLYALATTRMLEIASMPRVNPMMKTSRRAGEGMAGRQQSVAVVTKLVSTASAMRMTDAPSLNYHHDDQASR